MSIQRGFTRLTIAVSSIALALGVANDIWFMPPLPAGIIAELVDGRRLSLAEMPSTKPGESERVAVARALSDQYKPLEIPANAVVQIPQFIPDSIQPEQVRQIAVIKHGVAQRAAWWWANAEGLTLAVILDAILWTVFFTTLWIARGFAGRRSTS
jgi:hypothetical protein